NQHIGAVIVGKVLAQGAKTGWSIPKQVTRKQSWRQAPLFKQILRCLAALCEFLREHLLSLAKGVKKGLLWGVQIGVSIPRWLGLSRRPRYEGGVGRN